MIFSSDSRIVWLCEIKFKGFNFLINKLLFAAVSVKCEQLNCIWCAKVTKSKFWSLAPQGHTFQSTLQSIDSIQEWFWDFNGWNEIYTCLTMQFENETFVKVYSEDQQQRRQDLHQKTNLGIASIIKQSLIK